MSIILSRGNKNTIPVDSVRGQSRTLRDTIRNPTAPSQNLQSSVRRLKFMTGQSEKSLERLNKKNASLKTRWLQDSGQQRRFWMKDVRQTRPKQMFDQDVQLHVGETKLLLPTRQHSSGRVMMRGFQHLTPSEWNRHESGY